MGSKKGAVVALALGLVACSDAPIPPTPTASVGSSNPAAAQAVLAAVAAGIRAYLVSDADPVFGQQTRAERAELTALYQTGGDSPLWIDTTGRPSRQAHEAIAVLREARTEGLNPADYRNDHLDSLSAALTSSLGPLPGDLVLFEVALSRAMLRYLRHVHLGRIDPRTIGFRLAVSAEGHDFVAELQSALTHDRIAETVADLRPPLVQYDALRTMLATYRSLAADPSLESPPPAAASVHPGEPYAGTAVLYRYLLAFGDLPDGMQNPAAPETYDGPIVEGVKRFQSRHGLEPDGILGKGTQVALGVPLAWRVRQIELALERLRWLPDFGDRRLIAMNIPMFRFWAWDSRPADEAPSFAMNVIVGRALRTETPVFDEEMRQVIFRPYWNVPRSILRNEILPLIARDSDYLRRENMEIVQGDGDDAQPVEATPENLVRLRQGALRVRQRPGPDNALGLIKFVFPNQENVYMHGTPAQSLFKRNRRDFSHGCVRVEDPVALAEWVLRDHPDWTRDRVLEAMAGTQSFSVILPRPIQVLLYYTTAVVMPEDGTVHFADDIYRHDARLDRALARPHGSR